MFNALKENDINALRRIQDNFTRKAVMRRYGIDYLLTPSSRERNRKSGLKSLKSRRKIS